MSGLVLVKSEPNRKLWNVQTVEHVKEYGLELLFLTGRFGNVNAAVCISLSPATMPTAAIVDSGMSRGNRWMIVMAEIEEHAFVDEVTCPYCGYKFSDSWRFNTNRCFCVECPECDKKFDVEPNVEVTYTCRPDCALNDTAHTFCSEHESIYDGVIYIHRECRVCGTRQCEKKT